MSGPQSYDNSQKPIELYLDRTDVINAFDGITPEDAALAAANEDLNEVQKCFDKSHSQLKVYVRNAEGQNEFLALLHAGKNDDGIIDIKTVPDWERKLKAIEAKLQETVDDPTSEKFQFELPKNNDGTYKTRYSEKEGARMIEVVLSMSKSLGFLLQMLLQQSNEAVSKKSEICVINTRIQKTLADMRQLINRNIQTRGN
jgi:hypothetical protein